MVYVYYMIFANENQNLYLPQNEKFNQQLKNLGIKRKQRVNDSWGQIEQVSHIRTFSPWSRPYDHRFY